VVRRYAGDEAQQVLVIGGIDAPRRARRGVRRARPAEPGAVPVEVTRATVVGAATLEGEAAAETWLADASGPGADAAVAGALAVLNRALHARRVATADPYVRELVDADALVTRVGYGTGEEVAEGAWTAARELSQQAPRIARESALRPQERFAALLSGRDVALACELLALRTRADLEQGRDREAALQLEAALSAARAELTGWRELHGMAERLEELGALADGVAAAATAARAGTLDVTGREVVAAALGRIEAALRARTSSAQF
jgi:hypothetical protein